jgi:2-polyprenyl-6-methoxyphenol hydroxylase-like FAD-dependent oxidoreductase
VGFLPGQTAAERRLSLFWSVRTPDLQQARAAGIAPLRAAFDQLWPEAGALLSGMPDLSAWRPASYRDVVLSQPFVDRVLFIGDAAHGMSPQLGQGVNMALLDARALAQALDQHTTVSAALAGYADERAAHLRIYQFLSRWLTPLFQSNLDALAWWRDLLFLPMSRLPFSRGESLKILTGIKRGWFGQMRL